MRHWGQISLGGAKKAEFSKFFVLNAKFLEASCQTLLVAEVPNRYFGSQVTTHAELNEIVQYTVIWLFLKHAKCAVFRYSGIPDSSAVCCDQFLYHSIKEC
jgi:hypothetical protein